MPVTYDDCLFADRVLERSNTTGLDDFICVGTRIGYRTFLDAFDEDDVIVYLAEHETSGQWEIGKGTVGADGELTRDEIISSSDAGAKVEFDEGQKLIRCTMPAELLIQFAGFALPVVDTQALVKDPADGTKQMRIDAGAVATGQTRVLSMPNKNVDLGAAVLTDGTVAFAADQSLGGFKLTNLADPASAQDAATKSYVDAGIRGLDWKASCRAATTANITLSGAQTIDGVSVIAGDRVLVKNQSTGADNGIYVCASGSWSRAADADVSAEVTGGMAVTVTEGTANGDKTFVLTTNDSITLGSTSLSFSPLGDGNTTTLDGLTDVVITSPAANQSLRYIGGSWINTPAAASTPVSLSDGATITIDWALGNIFDVTLGGNRTIAFSNMTVGQCILLHVKQDGTGSRTLSWPGSVAWGGGSAPTLTTTAGRTDTIGLECKAVGGTPKVYARVVDLDVDI